MHVLTRLFLESIYCITVSYLAALRYFTVVTPNKAKIALFVGKSGNKWAKNGLVSQKRGKNCLI